MSETNIYKEAAKVHIGGVNKNLSEEQSHSLQTLYEERKELSRQMENLEGDIEYHQGMADMKRRDLENIETKIHDISQSIITLENL